ncbi:peptidase [Streptomyces sp. AcH 505]|uniref:prepilin peptidase n=1 Tax=Streptomyces sp. AcH 505 TaxID=352211 RepID=UPI00059237DC|nr:peptidase [Streptomyces sp. AcH 505]
MYAALIVLAAAWGAAIGLLLPRAAYRLSVEPEDPWRDSCPAGHPITGVARGWLGGAGCATCVAAGIPPTGAAGTGGDAATPAPAPAPDSPATGPAPDAGSTTDAGPATDTGAFGADRGAGPQFPAARVAYAPSVLVPVVTALVCGALAAATGPRPELVVWLLLAPFGVLLALVDSNVHRLPDQLTLSLAAAAPVLLLFADLRPGADGAWSTAVLGGFVLGFCYLVLFLINPSGMGFGDVKLALSLGVALGWYGWEVLFFGAFAGFLLGSLYGAGLILLRKAGRKSAIPFGPFMIGGTLLGLLAGALQ